MTPSSGKDLAALETEIHQSMQQRNYSDALDIYEEIEERGEMMPIHWVGKGDCLLKMRLKQDARDMYLRAVQLDPTLKVALDALDQNFPGWKQAKPAAPPPRPVAQQPAAPPPVAPPPPPAAQAPPPPPRPQPPPPQAPVRPAAPQAAPRVSADTAALSNPNRINWQFVMEDLQAALGENSRAAPSDEEQVRL